MDNKRVVTIQNIFSMDPIDMINFLAETYLIEIPEKIDSVEDLTVAGNKLCEIGAALQFFHELNAYAKRYVRVAKRSEVKEKWEDMVDRKDAIHELTEALTKVKESLSRAMTAYIQKQEEMNYK